MKHLTVSAASRIFRAMKGDTWAQEKTTIDEVTGMMTADTFGEFLMLNQIKTMKRLSNEKGDCNSKEN